MRIELENIQKTEKYFNGELTSVQKESFENEINSNAELQELLEQVKAFRTAVFRAELRKKIEINAPSGGGYGKFLIIGITVLIIGLLSWFYSGKNEVVINDNYRVVIQNDTTNSTLNQSDKTDSNEVANNQIKEELTIPVIQEQAINYILGGHKLWIEPKIQNFSFSNENGATIEGEDGMLVIIPENAFVNKEGNPVKGKVEFKLLEAFGISEMVLYNLKTVSNGSPLESGGMFYLEASLNGTPLRVNPKRPLYIEIPTVEKKEGMMAFNGEINSQGEINWVNPKPLEKYLVKVPFNDLHFLPEGFENEVHSVMPFFNHSRATSELVDSLYYALDFQFTNEGDISDSDIEFEEKEVRVSYKPYLIGMDSVVVDVLVLDDSATEASEVKDIVEVEPCGIDPLSIKTIKTKRFENTFIATKEFEARLHFLHKAPNGQELLNIYISNLSKNLFEVDSMVAQISNEPEKSRFIKFTNERLTNIKDAKIYQSRLNRYYRKKRKQYKSQQSRLAHDLSKKNNQKLAEILSQRNPIIFPQISQGFVNENVYATPWSTMGWGNIDKYMKLITKNRVEVSISISNANNETMVTQWLGEINTYTDLNKQENGFLAVFPEHKKQGNSATHVFSIYKDAQTYYWGMRTYNPYKVSKVEFKMEEVNVETIKEDLAGLEISFGKIKQRQKQIEKQYQQRIKREINYRKKTTEWAKKRNEINKQYKRELRKQNLVKEVMNQLRNKAFSCTQETSNIGIVRDDGVYYLVDNMPQFVGGESKMFQFLGKNVRYPNMALKSNITGTVYVSFVVETDGNLSGFKVLKGIGNGCDEEALRVVRLMPKWNPGSTNKNVVVPVQYNIPVKFSIK